MSIFNKDGLKETFSKFSNSAKDAAENVVKITKEGANTVAKKSGELVEISKLTFNISSEENKISNLYENIGQTIFEKHEKGIYIDPDVLEFCKDILCSKENILEIKKKISVLKNKKTCVKCGNEMDYDIVYCPKCGEEQPGVCCSSETIIVSEENQEIHENKDDSCCECSCKKEE